jgi:hypothetical protein
MVSKVGLLRHAEEWNKALDIYCNEAGLAGSYREAVVVKHPASPFAPYGKPSCGSLETL